MKETKDYSTVMIVLMCGFSAFPAMFTLAVAFLVVHSHFGMWGIAGLAVVLGVAVYVVVVWVRRLGAVRYANVPHGYIPPDWQTHPVVAVKKAPAVIRSVPPDGARAYESALVFERIEEETILAALWVDLIIRGYVQVVRYAREHVGFSAVSRELNSLTPPERHFMSALFGKASFVHCNVFKVADYDRVIRFARAFLVKTPLLRLSNASLWSMGGFIIVLASGGVVMGAKELSKSPVSLFVVIVSIVMLAAGVVALFAQPLTAYGQAVHEQCEGYRAYLETLRPEMSRWEQGVDVFSRDLAHAVAVGGGERWTAVCGSFASRYAVPKPAWIASTHAGAWATPEGYDTAALTVRTILGRAARLAIESSERNRSAA